jgi:hypothetical protein
MAPSQIKMTKTAKFFYWEYNTQIYGFVGMSQEERTKAANQKLKDLEAKLNTPVQLQPWVGDLFKVLIER